MSLLSAGRRFHTEDCVCVSDIEVEVHLVNYISCNFRQRDSMDKFGECISRKLAFNFGTGKA